VSHPGVVMPVVMVAVVLTPTFGDAAGDVSNKNHEERPEKTPKMAEKSTEPLKSTKSKASPPDVAKMTTTPAKGVAATTTTAPELSLDQLVVSFSFLLLVLTVMAVVFGCIFIVGGGMNITSMAAEYCVRRVTCPRAAVPVQTTRLGKISDDDQHQRGFDPRGGRHYDDHRWHGRADEHRVHGQDGGVSHWGCRSGGAEVAGWAADADGFLAGRTGVW
jgi:hypothetical protein